MIRLGIIATSAVLIGAPLQAKAVDQVFSGQVQRLFACRSVADGAQRLQCFDREAAAAAAAVEKHDLVFIDRERARVVRKERFGLTAPDFGGLFLNGDNDVTKIESTVASVGENQNGGMVVRLADGSVWTQTDDIFLGAARVGSKVMVERGIMGSYRVNIHGVASFKAKRIS